jgi:hypothetical protein
MMRDMDEKGEGELYAYARMGEGPPVGWRMSVKEARRRAHRERRREESRFHRAPFPLYGLPLSWAGERFLGGASWGSLSGKETIHSLSLVHGAIVEGEGPTLVVETAEPTAPEGGGTLRILAEQLWRGEAKSVHDALANFRRRSGNHHDAGLGPTHLRAEAVVSVEGRPTVFDVLSQPDHCVGRAKVGSWRVTIEGHEFGLEGWSSLRSPTPSRTSLAAGDSRGPRRLRTADSGKSPRRTSSNRYVRPGTTAR